VLLFITQVPAYRVAEYLVAMLYLSVSYGGQIYVVAGINIDNRETETQYMHQ
jgi:hypothetical protein